MTREEDFEQICGWCDRTFKGRVKRRYTAHYTNKIIDNSSISAFLCSQVCCGHWDRWLRSSGIKQDTFWDIKNDRPYKPPKYHILKRDKRNLKS